MSKINDPKIVTERLKKDIIKLVIDEVVIEGESVKIFATIPLPNKIHKREMDKTDIPGTFSARGGSAFGGNTGATLGPENETNMTRIWNKFTPLDKKISNGVGKQTNTPLKPRRRNEVSLRGRRKVFVGMSGGVDSSVAAFLLKKEGYDVTGVYINGFNVDGCSERDAEDARRVADHLGIPFYVIDAREDYFEYVVQYMIKGYKKGLTPNPDVMCNKEIKFGIFLDKALKLGADYIATGHYVRLVTSNQQPVDSKKKELPVTNYQLLVAKDLNKDQSYFLWTLTQEQLRYCLFPVGEYTKPEIREIAKKAKLPTAEKKDSQGICFLGRVKLPEFLKKYIKSKRGDVLDTEGNKIGEHEGAQFYTIGQRHLNIIQISPPKAGQPRAEKIHKDRKPYYVAEKNVKTNTLIVAQGDTHPALFKKEIELTDVHFINTEIKSLIRANRRIEVLVRVRYRQPLVKAVLVTSNQQSVISNKKLVNSKKGKLQVTSYQLLFSEPVKFVAPGQSAVFYLPAVVSTEAGGMGIDESGNHEMLGGGVILE